MDDRAVGIEGEEFPSGRGEEEWASELARAVGFGLGKLRPYRPPREMLDPRGTEPRFGGLLPVAGVPEADTAVLAAGGQEPGAGS